MNKTQLSKRETQILNKIVKYRQKHGHSPTTSHLTNVIFKKEVTRQYIESVVKILIKKGALKPIKPIKQGWFEPVDNVA